MIMDSKDSKDSKDSEDSEDIEYIYCELSRILPCICQQAQAKAEKNQVRLCELEAWV